MGKGITELVFILDKSGSMSGLEDDTVQSFNSMLHRQKNEDGRCTITTVLFNTYCKILYDHLDIQQVVPMTRESFAVQGCTALLDAIGSTIGHIENLHHTAYPDEIPEQTLFVIITDGMENASRIYSRGQVRAMIKRKQAHSHWEFLFLGANMDAIHAASRIGIQKDHAVTFTNDTRGIATNYAAISEAIRIFRSRNVLSATWKSSIEKDHNR